MKKSLLIFTMILSMLMVMSGVTSVFADSEARGEGYGYTVTIYSGEQGQFADGSTKKTYNVKAGETVDIAKLASDAGFEVTNNEYYNRGFREAGHDNDESPSLVSFKADKDVAYEAAYGIKGNMVKYTIMYLDENGDELQASNEYYGMVGDKPVVSYLYIDGYQPNAYNLTKTLTADENKNIFGFSYMPNPENETVVVDNTAGNNGQAGARNAANGQNNANANAAANDANANGPTTIVDLDDNATPQAENAGNGATDIADTDAPKAGISPIAIGGGVVALAAIAALAAFLIRRRNSEYEDDDEEENYNRSKSIYSDQE